MGVTLGLIATAGFVLLQGTWSDPITATVIDSETNQPIEGVVVVADWGLKGGLEGNNPVGHLAVMESVSDNAGKFHFPGWGPRFSIRGQLRAEQPELLFFKGGYSYLHVGNEAAGRWHGMRVKSIVNGTRVKLEKFCGTPKEYVENVQRLESTLDSYLFGDDKACPWKKIPRMIHALDEQIQLSPGYVQGIFSASHQHLIAAEEYYLKIGCGSAKEFLTGIAK